MTRAVRRYITLLSALFWISVAVATITGAGVPDRPLILVAPLVGLAIAAEALVVSRQDTSASFSVAAHIAAAILFGPLVAAFVAAIGVLLVDGLRLGPRPSVWLNSAIFGLSAAAGGIAFLIAGGSVGSMTEHDIAPAVILIAVRFMANEGLLAVAISLDSGVGILRQLRDGVRELAGAAISEGSLGVLVAFGYTPQHWVLLPFLVPLLAALYVAQLNFERLKRETAAALNAFAGVIDERDPNTASHSKRVAEYVERFTTAIELPDREAARLIQAARYHDLGKVVVDESTLSRPGRLSEDELRKIRSHPALSARLLSPFHFAQEMSVYAELHHERYDGRGYYSVPQREIPVEAHVLIAADSFDAMTSARAYRPALSTAEAIHELRDKAGTQFHPLVAQALAAVLEGRDLHAAMGSAQIAALRAEFSRIASVQLPRPDAMFHPRAVTVCLASTTGLALGVSAVPMSVAVTLAIATLLVGTIAVLLALRERRRRRILRTTLSQGQSAGTALEAAGVPGHLGRLNWNQSEHQYDLTIDGDAPGHPGDLEEVRLRAARVGIAGRAATLESGVHYTITPARNQESRLVIWTNRPLTRFETELLDEAANTLRANDVRARGLTDVSQGERRNPARLQTSRMLIVELHTFENVRSVAGQLSAERVVMAAAAALSRVVRQDDRCEQMGEDTFRLTVAASRDDEVAAVCERVREALAEVPVPSRVAPITPSIKPVQDNHRATG
jgi:HD-GYP domain-containing protein (c-di-GMP phosphodiesterase class II)/GGDEF domain-containing protein